MFKKVLVANRGEIAVQIIRALHELNITAVAIYSSADKDALFVQLADEAICIGGPQPAQSYLNMSQILSAANLTGCEAIHPGYGFLSENAEFARLCAECHIAFIGPTPEVIDLMGDKAHARAAMQKSGVPVIPGSEGTVASLAEAMTTAHRIGYPILLKAAEGGGGKGIRAVAAAADLPAAFRETQREARLNYGDDRIYIEKLVTNAKHIEMQVIADTHGHIVYLPERDCSMQRHHQKVIEESPCQDITPAERAKLGNIVVQACHQIGYTNTGTFEFLMDSHHHFYFLEMNTRLQVEHTVTEEVTGLQLIKAMVRVAAGESLPFTQADAQVKGYALECRINAEDPANNFRPSPGTLQQLYLPDGTLGVRIDSGVTTGSTIPPFYDAMIAKLIVHLPTREETIVKMQRVLGECIVRGIAINRDFLQALLASPKFADAQYTTDYIEQEFLPEWRSKRDVTA